MTREHCEKDEDHHCVFMKSINIYCHKRCAVRRSVSHALMCANRVLFLPQSLPLANQTTDILAGKFLNKKGNKHKSSLVVLETGVLHRGQEE